MIGMLLVNRIVKQPLYKKLIDFSDIFIYILFSYLQHVSDIKLSENV